MWQNPEQPSLPGVGDFLGHVGRAVTIKALKFRPAAIGKNGLGLCQDGRAPRLAGNGACGVGQVFGIDHVFQIVRVRG